MKTKNDLVGQYGYWVIAETENNTEEQKMNDDKTYEIVRFVFQGDDKVIKTGLTLEEAQEWCQREDTHGDGWFDGYREE